MIKIRDISKKAVFRIEPRGATSRYWIKINEKEGERTALYKESIYSPLAAGGNAEKDEMPFMIHLGEYIYAELCKKVDIPCAKIEIAKNKEQIGCLSYDVREDIDRPEDSENYILKLLDQVITVKEPSFNADNSIVVDTGEKLSLELVEKSFREVTKANPIYFSDLMERFLEVCLMDSLTSYNDRHAKNFGVVVDRESYNEKRVLPIESFDNGDCFGLKIRNKDLKKLLAYDEEEKNEELNRLTSKVGTDENGSTTFSNLRRMIFFHYMPYVRDLAERMKTELTEENLSKILDEIPIELWSKNHRTLVETIFARNRKEFLDDLTIGEVVNTLQDKMTSKENINRKDAINQYWSESLFENNKVHEIFTIEDLLVLTEIQASDMEYGENLTQYEKDIAIWGYIYNRMCAALQKDSKFESREIAKSKLNQLFGKTEDSTKTSYNFVDEDLSVIARVADLLEEGITEKSAVEFRKFIDNELDNTAKMQKITRVMFIMERARCMIYNDEPAIKIHNANIENFKTMIECEKFIKQKMPGNPEIKSFAWLDKIGLTADEKREVMYAVVQESMVGKKFDSVDSFKAYSIEVAKEIFEGRKTYAEDIFISNEEVEKIQKSMELTNDSKKIAVDENGEIEDFENKAFKLGFDYAIKEGTRKGATKQKFRAIAVKKGVEIPENLIKKMEKHKKMATDENGKVKKTLYMEAIGKETDAYAIKYVIGENREATKEMNREKEEEAREI